MSSLCVVKDIVQYDLFGETNTHGIETLPMRIDADDQYFLQGKRVCHDWHLRKAWATNLQMATVGSRGPPR
jgi:hypothetical protein